MPISITTAAMISEFLEAYDPPDNRYLFPSAIKKDGHWSVDNVEKVMARACKRLGIERITPHSLRHFYATAMLKNGAKLEVVHSKARPECEKAPPPPSPGNKPGTAPNRLPA